MLPMKRLVKYFLEGKIGFVDIMKYVAKNIESHRGQKVESIQDVLEIDAEARQKFKNLVEGEKN